MAEGWIRHLMGNEVEVFSAGTRPSAVHPLAVQVMAEVGVDISAHRSRPFSDFLAQPFDLVMTVCDSAREACPVLPGARRHSHESIPDPLGWRGEGDPIEPFRKIRDLIRERVVGAVRHELDLHGHAG
jgi:arsenate reductase